VHGHTNELVLKAVLLSWLLALVGLSFFLALLTLLRRLLGLLLFRVSVRLRALFAKPIFLAHHLVVGVRAEVEQLRELEVLVNFVVLERVEVEDDALQVHDEDVWGLSDQSALADVHLLLAATALVIANDLACDQLGQALVHPPNVLDGE
jgi:hypothetical protein